MSFRLVKVAVTVMKIMEMKSSSLSSVSVALPTMSNCTSDTSTTVSTQISRARCEPRSLASVLQRATPSNLCWKRVIQKIHRREQNVRPFHLVVLISQLNLYSKMY